MLATGGFSFPGSRWSVRATVLRIPAAGLSGTDDVCPGRIARGFEPDPQEAVHRIEGYGREFRVFNNFVINVDIELSSRLPSLRYQMTSEWRVFECFDAKEATW